MGIEQATKEQIKASPAGQEQASPDMCDQTCTGTGNPAEAVRMNMLAEPLVSQMSDLFKALGDATRIRIIHALQQSELCVHDIAEVLDMGQSAVSHQLRYLRNLRIVKRRKVGKTVFYSLDDDHIEQIFVQTLQHLRHE